MCGSAIEKIAVIGAGKMGNDIFNFLREHHYSLAFISFTKGKSAELQKKFSRRLERQVTHGIITPGEKESLKEKTVFSEDITEAARCDLIIEAVAEDIELKRSLFHTLENIVAGDPVLASNSSSIKPSLMSGGLRRKERLLGLHFVYPAKQRNIVELIVSDETGRQYIDRTRDFLSELGRVYIEQSEESAFILNRIFLDMQAQAFRFYNDGVLSMKEIDSVVSGSILPAGIFDFFDSVGLDVMRSSIGNYLKDVADLAFYRPMMETLDRYCSDGRTGRNNRIGFYASPEAAEEARDALQDESRIAEVRNILTALYINAACKAVETGICPAEKLEYALKEYLGSDRGPFELMEILGADAIHSVLNVRFSDTGYECYRPAKIITEKAAREQ